MSKFSKIIKKISEKYKISEEQIWKIIKEEDVKWMILGKYLD